MQKQYPINDIFYSLQGEGYHTGLPSAFIRFSGCNLKCQFCDTDHNLKQMLTAQEIINQVRQYDCEWLVLTGGEPSLWIDEELLAELHKYFKIAIETNGTRQLSEQIDWITVSPKQHLFPQAKVVVRHCNELKMIWQEGIEPNEIMQTYYKDIQCDHLLLQPCDTGNKEKNAQLIKETINYCLQHKHWRMSVQLHKILNIK
ncbi:MAG: radical SAM protein [Paludibacteraceae bacterium]|nr:radical SAM protein [Paludibacteraceae bacterium]